VRIAGPELGNARVLVVGDGPEREALAARAAAAGIAERVTFVGSTRDVIGLYAAMDVLVLPSLQEGSPNVVLEAMACGLPVVASAVGGVPEIIDEERTGYLVAPGDANALARKLALLAHDRARRVQLGRASRRRIEDHFDIRQTVEHHAALYRRLLSAAGRCAPAPSSEQ
jgi:glycosyltransferase involved in cell wall biosynthesis